MVGSNKVVRLLYKTINGSDIGGVWIKFAPYLQFKLGYCSNDRGVDNGHGGEDFEGILPVIQEKYVWRITKVGLTFSIHCNGELMTERRLERDYPTVESCLRSWSKEAASVEFSNENRKKDTASVEYCVVITPTTHENGEQLII